jgi:hypothetical protein
MTIHIVDKHTKHHYKTHANWTDVDADRPNWEKRWPDAHAVEVKDLNSEDQSTRNTKQADKRSTFNVL